MPNFKLSDPDARDVSAFLIASSTPLAGDTESDLKIQKAPTRRLGASLYGESFCSSAMPCRTPPEMWWAAMSAELTRVGNKVKRNGCGHGCAIRVSTIRERPCRTTVSPIRKFRLLTAFLEVRRFRSAGQCASRRRHAGTDSARQGSGDRIRLRFMPRNQRHQEAG